MSFDLRQNAFAVLGVPPEASRDDINHAYRDRQLDMETAEQERTLELARQALFSPRERLEAELAYLLELSKADITATLGELGGGSSRAPSAIAGLAAINLFIHCHDALRTSQEKCWPQPALDIVEAYGRLDRSRAYEKLASIRRASGFGSVSRTDFEEALTRLRLQHADLLMRDDGEPSSVQLLDLVRSDNDARPEKRRFIHDLLDRHAIRVTRRTEDISATVEGLLEDVAGGGSAGSRLQELRTLLAEWQTVMAPLQERDARQGLEEPISLALLSRIRKTTLELNGAGHDDDALAISKAALAVCERMPQFAERLRTDIDTLASIVAHTGRSARLANIRAAIAQCRKKLSGFRGGHVPAGAFDTLFQSLQTLIASGPDKEVIDLAIAEIRNLAIDLHNDHDNVEAAIAITKHLEGAAVNASEETRSAIRSDLAKLWRGRSWDLLGKALSSRRWGEAERLCDELLAEAEGEERSNLVKIRQSIAGKRKGRRTTAIVWAGILAIPVLIGIFNSGKTPSSDPTYETVETVPEETESVEAPPEAEAVQPIVPLGGADDGEETMPSPGGDERNLTRQELRYCMKQGKRLDAARMTVNGYGQQSQYNALVNDYNNRCGNFHYNSNDMNSVNLEIMSQSYQLQEEGRGLITQSPLASPLTNPGYGSAGTYGSPGNGDSVSEDNSDPGYNGGGY